MTATAKTLKKRRQKLRQRLKAAGVPVRRIEEIVASKSFASVGAYEAAGEAAERAQAGREAEMYARLQPDDRRFRPLVVDPLRRGQARVSEVTALAARRRKAMTRDEWEQAQARAAEAGTR